MTACIKVGVVANASISWFLWLVVPEKLFFERGSHVIASFIIDWLI